MTHVTLVLGEAISEAIRDSLLEERETAGVLLVGVAKDADGNVRLLAREIHWIPDESYLERKADGLSIASEGYVPALARAADINATALWFHTHPGPGSSPRPSRRDEHVDDAVTELFKLRTESDNYGTLICAADDDGRVVFTGHVDVDGIGQRPIERLWEVGRRFRLTTAQDAPKAVEVPEVFDRNVRAFGGDVQRVLGELDIAVVGCGGTGSAVAEQLVRLGVRHLTLIDPDVLTESNLTRVYGSTSRDVGSNKAVSLARYLRRLAPDLEVRSHSATINTEAVARKLIRSDVVFGCTDDNAGRLILSRLATYLLTPVIDSGVLLSSDDADLLTGIDGRVTTLVPGAACLVCRDRIDLRRARAEVLSPEERQQLQAEGYAAALPGIEPAVVTYTTMVAAVAVSELLERLIGFGPEPAPSEVLLRFHDREVSTNVGFPRPGHYCDPAAGKQGLGGTDPFLEQTWGD